MIPYIVPTRNNPTGLASLLGSIVSLHGIGEKPLLFLMDGSNDPVITNNHLARLLTRFDLQYRHFTAPNVNMQRIEGISIVKGMFGDAAPFVLVDDDHVLLTMPTKAMQDFSKGADGAKAYFGICVDVLNDKGYPDYEWIGSGKMTTHAFPSGYAVQPYPISGAPEATANPGFLVTTAAHALDRLRSLHARFNECPAVADDAWACALADPPMMHTALQAMHIGNNNNWWRSQVIKHTAVRLARSTHAE